MPRPRLRIAPPRRAGRRCALTLAAAALLTIGPSAGRAAERPAGRAAMVVHWTAPVRMGERQLGSVRLGDLLTATRRNGGWIWVAERRGWVPRAALVPLEDAEEHFSRALEEELSAGGFHRRGVARAALGDLRGALADFDAALERGPATAALHTNRGNTLQRLGELDRALADYDRALQLDRGDAVAYNNRSSIWAARGDLTRALADLEEALEVDGRYASALNNRGVTHCQLGRFAEAIDDFSAAIEVDPRYASPRLNRGAAREASGDVAGAIDDYRAATELAPQTSEAHRALAWLLATAFDDALRSGDDAMRHGAEACRLTDLTDSRALDALAAACAEARRFGRATEAARRALAAADEADRDPIAARLALYEAGRPYRQAP